jgi:hypothetical protein
MSGSYRPYPGKVGVIEADAYADLLLRWAKPEEKGGSSRKGRAVSADRAAELWAKDHSEIYPECSGVIMPRRAAPRGPEHLI